MVAAAEEDVGSPCRRWILIADRTRIEIVKMHGDRQVAVHFLILFRRDDLPSRVVRRAQRI